MSRLSIDRLKSMICGLTLVALAFLFMGESLLPDKMLAPLDAIMGLRPWSRTVEDAPETYNTLPSDKVLYIHPIKVLVGQGWRSGVPLWEPRLLGGYPIIGNAQAGIFYPGTLPYVFLHGADASDVAALFHLIAAGLGMFGYLRALGCSHLAALLGALVFMLNGVFTVWLMWDSVAGAMVWLPWALWAFEAALRPGRLRMIVLGVFAVALIYLGGHLQWSLYAMLALGLYSVFRFITLPKASRRRVVLIVAALGVGGTALAAIQLLPTLQYINMGHRGSIPFEVMSERLDWSGFLMLWVPRFFGSSSGPAWHGPSNYNEMMIYVGIAPLLLALVSVIGRRDALTVFFFGLGLLGALGAAATDVYRVLHWLPGFDSLMPVRMRYLIVVGLAVLSALGLDWLMRLPNTRRAPIALGSVGGAIGLGLVYAVARTGYLPDDPVQREMLHQQEQLFVFMLIASAILLALCGAARHWRRLGLTGLCVLTLVDLWPPAVAYQRPISTQFYYPLAPGIQIMMSDPDRFRVVTLRRDWSQWPLRPNLAAMYGLSDVGGYDSTYMRRYVDYIRQIDKTGPAFAETNFLSPTHFDSPLVDLLNVKYAVTPERGRFDGWEVLDRTGMRVYRRTSPLPRVWIASQARVIADDAAILEQLTQPDFDPRRTVILERPPAEPIGIDSATPAGSVRVEQYGNTRLTLTAEMQRDGWLVLSEMYHPSWHVAVDGAPADLYRANYIFRAVPLSPGRHTITMSFIPDSFVAGAIISVCAMLILLVAAGISFRLEHRVVRSLNPPDRRNPDEDTSQLA